MASDFGHGLDLVLRPLLEEEQGPDGSRAIFSYPRQFSGERSSTGAIAGVNPADVRHFIGQQSHVWRRKARDGGLTGARDSGEQKGASVADGPSGMQEESRLPAPGSGCARCAEPSRWSKDWPTGECGRARRPDSTERENRRAAAATCRPASPLGHLRQEPCGMASSVRCQIQIWGRGGIDKTGVAAGQHLPEGIVLRVQEDRHASDLDCDLVARIHSRAAPWHGFEIARASVRSLCCANECIVDLVVTFAAVSPESQPNPPEETPVAKQPGQEPAKR